MNPQFDVNALKTGDMQQLKLFCNTEGERSIYVEWVPDQMTKDAAEMFFSPIGPVKAIDFVNHKNSNSRMMFVHFERFYRNEDPNVTGIAEMYPLAYEIPFSSPIYKNSMVYQGNYMLRCRINLTPTPRVEYNMAQLTEMVDRLRTELEYFKTEVAIMKRQMNVEKLEDSDDEIELGADGLPVLRQKY
jgi:hypothetical protein